MLNFRHDGWRANTSKCIQCGQPCHWGNFIWRRPLRFSASSLLDTSHIIRQYINYKIFDHDALLIIMRSELINLNKTEKLYIKPTCTQDFPVNSSMKRKDMGQRPKKLLSEEKHWKHKDMVKLSESNLSSVK